MGMSAAALATAKLAKAGDAPALKPADRAGAYDIDESGDLIVGSYTGSYENIMGLPVEPLMSIFGRRDRATGKEKCR